MQSYSEQDILTQNNDIARIPAPSTDLLKELEDAADRAAPSTEDLLVVPEEEAFQLAQVSVLYRCWQRTLDMLFAITGLLLLLLLLPFLALVIYLDSPGPIFYHQERVGYRGRRFLMHKIRSMHPTTEQTGRLRWKIAGDQRVTHIGRFMRATHLDELPQAINILRGEMALIGPRPQRPEYVARLEESSPLYRSRLEIKPGLTGWAQVNYGYGNSYHDDLTKLQYDLYYIAHRSFKLDIIILMRTVLEVIQHRGDK